MKGNKKIWVKYTHFSFKDEVLPPAFLRMLHTPAFPEYAPRPLPSFPILRLKQSGVPLKSLVGVQAETKR